MTLERNFFPASSNANTPSLVRSRWRAVYCASCPGGNVCRSARQIPFKPGCRLRPLKKAGKYIESTCRETNRRRRFSIETGFLAKQAAGSVLGAVRRHRRAGRRGRRTAPAGLSDFFPLTCDYRERHRRGRQVSRRLPQARRPADDQGNAHRAADGSADPAAVSRVVSRRSADAELRAGQRSAERRRRAGDERRIGRRSASRRCRSRARSARSAWVTSTASSCRSRRRMSWKRAIST